MMSSKLINELVFMKFEDDQDDVTPVLTRFTDYYEWKLSLPKTSYIINDPNVLALNIAVAYSGKVGEFNSDSKKGFIFNSYLDIAKDINPKYVKDALVRYTVPDNYVSDLVSPGDLLTGKIIKMYDLSAIVKFTTPIINQTKTKEAIYIQDIDLGITADEVNYLEEVFSKDLIID